MVVSLEKPVNLFNKKWNQNLTSGTNPKYNSKLRTYITFKTDICLEKYLQNNDNIKSRDLFTKLRLPDHKLAIESERRKQIKLENRLCLQCKNRNCLIEDEFHFIMICDKYSNLREKLYKTISGEAESFISLDDREKFKYIMSYNSHLSDILDYIYKCFS